ncbi:MAG: hypothetical protein Q4D98_12915 [Planctomycetia bacterium]|nr:hypothetical protein [Planctomycetia bacterium]
MIRWLSLLLLLGGSCLAEKPDAERLFALAAKNYEKNWNRLEREGTPWPGYSVRHAADYCMVLTSTGTRTERTVTLLNVIDAMREKNPDAPQFGNFRWYWQQTEVKDVNAAEFVLERLLFCRFQRDRLPQESRDRLDTIIPPAVENIFRRNATSEYTNIALLNASNLILAGEQFGCKRWKREGIRRLDRFLFHTYEQGVSEFTSSVYYAVDMEALSLLSRWTQDAAVRDKANALLEYFSTEIALLWWPPGNRLAGPSSRTYHPDDGDPYLRYVLQCWGWEPMPENTANITHVGILNGGYFPEKPATLTLPENHERIVRYGKTGVVRMTSAWAMGCRVPCECRPDDQLFALDLPGKPRLYYLLDGSENPYGKRRFPASNDHPRSYHLRPAHYGMNPETLLENPPSLTLAPRLEKGCRYAHPDMPLSTLQSHVLLPVPDTFSVREKTGVARYGNLQIQIASDAPWVFETDAPDGRSVRLTANFGDASRIPADFSFPPTRITLVEPPRTRVTETVDFLQVGRALLERRVPELKIHDTAEKRFCPLFWEDGFLLLNAPVEYRFRAAQEGTYVLRVFVQADDARHNSFWLRENGGTERAVSLPVSPEGTWVEIFRGFRKAGEVSTFSLRPREYNVRLQLLRWETPVDH